MLFLLLSNFWEINNKSIIGDNLYSTVKLSVGMDKLNLDMAPTFKCLKHKLYTTSKETHLFLTVRKLHQLSFGLDVLGHFRLIVSFKQKRLLKAKKLAFKRLFFL